MKTDGPADVLSEPTLKRMKIFLVRHATPDWNRTDIPYDIPPGPPLSSKGEQEAEALALFLKAQSVGKLYYSPFERTTKTAQIVASVHSVPTIPDPRLMEWRGDHEPQDLVRARMKTIFDEAVKESAEIGSIGLVSHGGPIDMLLQQLGIDPDELAVYRTRFDTVNPLPPAGAWEVEWDETSHCWKLHLTFIPMVT